MSNGTVLGVSRPGSPPAILGFPGVPPSVLGIPPGVFGAPPGVFGVGRLSPPVYTAKIAAGNAFGVLDPGIKVFPSSDIPTV